MKVKITLLMQGCIQNLAKHLSVKIVNKVFAIKGILITALFPLFLVQSIDKTRTYKFTSKEPISKCVSVAIFCVPIQMALTCLGIQH